MAQGKDFAAACFWREARFREKRLAVAEAFLHFPGKFRKIFNGGYSGGKGSAGRGFDEAQAISFLP